MADETTASVIPLRQIQPKKKKPKPLVPRAKAERPRKKAAAEKAIAERPAAAKAPPASSDHLIPLEFLTEETEPVTAPEAATETAPRPAQDTAPREAAPAPSETPRPRSRLHVSSVLLTAAALALAVVGMTMNGWFARSLGSTDMSGWLFLAVGVAADLAALTLPSSAARLWQSRQRATSLAAWAVWLMTFAFAITAGIGFASVNIADVTSARAARVTPVIQIAQAALSDAMTARDRECKGGVGKFCREREAAVNDRRQALDTALAAGAATADPQSEAAVHLVAWVSGGALHPSDGDFAMLRLVLLALLPQIGGILLMVSRAP